MSRNSRPTTLFRPLELLRALLAGGAATIVDLVVLALFTSAIGLSPRLASVPALIAGGVVSFFANRHWVFRSPSSSGGGGGDGSPGGSLPSLPAQAALYVVVELVALTLNGVLYDGAMRTPWMQMPSHAAWYLPLRLVTSHIVFLVWSYPLWRLVFRPRVHATT